MARQARLQASSLPHHVLQQGHSGNPVFVDDEDRRHYLGALMNVSREHRVDVHAYVLLPSRVQLLVRPQTPEGLSRMMQALGRRYVPWFNQRHQRTGTLWEGRFRAHLLEPGDWVLRCQRSIELLPVRMGLAPGLLACPWSSVLHHLGAERNPLITDAAEHWQLGNTPFEREAAYRQWLDQGVADQEWNALATALRSGKPLGGEAFFAYLTNSLGWRASVRRPGRPRKSPATSG